MPHVFRGLEGLSRHGGAPPRYEAGPEVVAQEAKLDPRALRAAGEGDGKGLLHRARGDRHLQNAAVQHVRVLRGVLQLDGRLFVVHRHTVGVGQRDVRRLFEGADGLAAMS